jgi:adenylyltransferase/sulfurtransferase
MSLNIDYEVYFKRQIDLWGLDKQHSLKNKKIAIIGAGGLGSSLSYALGSLGIGEIVIVDFDEVAIHNIHRQISFSITDIDNKKALVSAERQKNRSPFSKIISFIGKFSDFIKTDLALNLDLIFDGTDNFETRLEIDIFAKNNNLAWVFGAVEGFYGNFAIIKDSDFRNLKNLKQTPKGVATPMVMNIASFEANIGLRYLIGENILTDYLNIVSFDLNGFPILKSFKL